MSTKNNNQTQHPQTPDSYDAHIIPAETAARKDREGNNYKQIPENSEITDSIDTTGGYTVDKEGLVNNYADEPEIYVDTPGDLGSNSTSVTSKCTIVDTFPSPMEAESIVLEMKKAGLDTGKISILSKDYQDTEHVHGVLNWKNIAQAGGLVVVLKGLGISNEEALKHEAALEAGKCLVLVIGSEKDIRQAYQILYNIGHRSSEVNPI
jgi:hypothetical protein